MLLFRKLGFVCAIEHLVEIPMPQLFFGGVGVCFHLLKHPFFFFLDLVVLCVNILSACMCVHGALKGQTRSGPRVDSSEPLCGFWESTLEPQLRVASAWNHWV